jgi:hypothetical protein
LYLTLRAWPHARLDLSHPFCGTYGNLPEGKSLSTSCFIKASFTGYHYPASADLSTGVLHLRQTIGDVLEVFKT